jgi:hypothetical protein
VGILGSFSAVPNANASEWLSTVDVYILKAIQDGYALSVGIAQQGEPHILPTAFAWEEFFRAWSGQQIPPGELLSLWGAAEQAATDYGVVAAQAGGLQPTISEVLFTQFWGDIWRGAITYPAAHLLLTDANPAGPVAGLFGSWFFSPANEAGIFAFSYLYWLDSMYIWGQP